MSSETSHGQRGIKDRDVIRAGALLLIPFLNPLAASGRAASVAGPHGSVDLVAEQNTVPDRPFWVGLHFQLEQGWHIYWTNPGDSGEPPRVKWTLPAGFQAGPLYWPVPRRIEDHSLIDYGYLNEVLLPVEIRPSATPSVRSDLRVSATVNWLVCRETCVPGRAALALTLPMANGTRGQPSAWHSLFAKARAELSQPAPKLWKSTAVLDGHRFVLNVETGKQERGATFFPLEPIQIENAAPQKVRPSSRGIRVELQRSDQLLKAPPQLRGVLVFASGYGYLIEAPVTASK